MSVSEGHQLTPRRMATHPKDAAGDQAVTIPQDQDKDKTKKKMEEDYKNFNIIFGVTQGIGLLCVVLMLVWTASYRGGFGWSSKPDLQFNWHPLLMTIGLIYLFANSIMIYRALRTMRKQKLKLIHAAIHGVVVLCIIIAQVAVFSFHNAKGFPNLYSLHSWIGLTAVILYVGQWIMSLLIYLYPGAPLPIRSSVMPWHVFLGLTIFVLSVATAISGLLEKATFSLPNYSELPGEGVLINFIGLLFVLFCGLVVYLTTEFKYKRHPRPEDGALLNTSPTE